MSNSPHLTLQKPLLAGCSEPQVALQPVVKTPLAETAVKIGLFLLFAGMIGMAVTLSPSIQAHIGKIPAITSGVIVGAGFILTVVGLVVDARDRAREASLKAYKEALAYVHAQIDKEPTAPYQPPALEPIIPPKKPPSEEQQLENHNKALSLLLGQIEMVPAQQAPDIVILENERQKPVQFGFLTESGSSKDAVPGEASAYSQGKKIAIKPEQWSNTICRKALKETLSEMVGDPKRHKTLSEASSKPLNNQIKRMKKLSTYEKIKLGFLFDNYHSGDIKQMIQEILKDNPACLGLSKKLFMMFTKARNADLQDGSIQVDSGDLTRAQKQAKFAEICDQSIDDEDFIEVLKRVFQDDPQMLKEIVSIYATLKRNFKNVLENAARAGLERIRLTHPQAFIKEVHFNDMGDGRIECFVVFQIAPDVEIYHPAALIFDVREIEAPEIEIFELVNTKPNPAHYFWNAERVPRGEMEFDHGAPVKKSALPPPFKRYQPRSDSPENAFSIESDSSGTPPSPVAVPVEVNPQGLIN